MDTISYRFDYARKQRDISFRELGELFGITGDAVRKAIERGTVKPRFIKTFSDTYQISLKWLETGEGNLEDFHSLNIVSEPDTTLDLKPKVTAKKGAPYYDVDFIGGFDVVMNNQSAKPTFYIDFPGFNDVDCWINITGKSMSPFISHGDIVALKRVNNWNDFLLFGEIYAIVSDEFRTIKIIGKSEIEGNFKLIPYSKSPEFSEQDIPKSIIKEVYRVKGSLKKFF